MKPKAIILSGYGLNCEEETAFTFKLAGADAEIVHINDLIAAEKKIEKYQILAIPGGFSYGDDTGSGKAYANKLNNQLGGKLREFAESEKLIIGICNGFQILTQTGLLPGALIFNDNARYTVRWVDVKTTQPVGAAIGRPANKANNIRPYIESPWLMNIDRLSLPIAHGEGKFYADAKTLNKLAKNGQIALKYTKGEYSKTQKLPFNPNGSLQDIAAVTNYDGRILGMMPHPERAIFFTQLPNWTLQKEKITRDGRKIPKFTNVLKIFKNAVKFFK